MSLRVLIVPGNGCTPVKGCNWYNKVRKQLITHGFSPDKVVLRDMPDPYDAKESIWIPYDQFEKLK